MKKILRIYKACLRVAFATAATYRANFLMNLFILLLSNILFPLVTLLIYGAGARFPGWSLYEVLLIQSIFTLSTGVANIFFNGILRATMNYIVEGTFEVVLVKPVDTLIFLLSTTIEIDSAGLLLGGGILFAVSVSFTGVNGSLAWPLFILFFLAGLFVMLGFALIMAATSFKWVANSRIPEIFDSLKSFGKYPLGIFPSIVAGFASFIIPVAMIGFFPACALLGKTQPAMFIALLPCILFALAGVLLYRHMVRYYEGVGG